MGPKPSRHVGDRVRVLENTLGLVGKANRVFGRQRVPILPKQDRRRHVGDAFVVVDEGMGLRDSSS
jgi:hypothetical protein